MELIKKETYIKKIFLLVVCITLFLLFIVSSYAMDIRQAIEQGDIKKVQEIVQKNPDIINQRDNEFLDNQPIHFAVIYGQNEILEYLISQGADVDAENNNTNPLFLSIYSENLEICKLLIKNKCNVNCSDNTYPSPLFPALLFENYSIFKYLLINGVNVNTKIENTNSRLTVGWTILHMASEKGNSELVELLLSKGANIEAKDLYGKTPLFYAFNKDILRNFISKGVDVNVRDNNNNAVIFEIAGMLDKDTMKYCLSKGINPDIKDKEGNSLLQFMALYGEKDIVKLLVSKGADVHSVNNNNTAVIHSAVLSGKVDIVRFLVNKGADLTIEDKNGNTVLHYAVQGKIAYSFNKKRIELIDYILSQGIDINKLNNNNSAAIDCIPISTTYKEDIEIYLLKNGANVNFDKIIALIRSRNWGRIKKLLTFSSNLQVKILSILSLLLMSGFAIISYVKSGKK